MNWPMSGTHRVQVARVGHNESRVVHHHTSTDLRLHWSLESDITPIPLEAKCHHFSARSAYIESDAPGFGGCDVIGCQLRRPASVGLDSDDTFIRDPND